MNTYYKQYYLRQSGGGLSDIGSIYKTPLFHQKGRGGIGNFFGSVLRHFRPLLSSGLSALKSEAIKTGSAVLSEIGKKPIRKILKEQGTIALNNLSERGINKIKKMQKGSGRRKKKNIKSGRVKKRNHSSTKRKRKYKQKIKQIGGRKRKSKGKKRKSKKTRFVDIFENN